MMKTVGPLNRSFVSKQRKRSRNGLDAIFSAFDLMLAGHNTVIGQDFLLTRQDFVDDIGHLDPKALRTYDEQFVETLQNLEPKQKNIALGETLSDLLQDYEKKRDILGAYETALYERVLSYDIEAAQELGNFDDFLSKIVIRNDSEMNVFYDYIALYRALNGKRAVVQWNLDTPKLINKKNKQVVMTYELAKFAVLRLDQNLGPGGIRVTNVITQKECLLIDKALYASEKEGGFFICSLLDMGDYVMSSGGGTIIDSNSLAGKSTLTLLKKHLAKLRATDSAFNSDIAACVREIYGFCIRGGALKYQTIK